MNSNFSMEFNYMRKMFLKNKKILNCPVRKVNKSRVNLHWWSTRRSDNMENVGDYLSLVICEYMLQKRNLSFETKVEKTKHLYGVGSIIQGGAQNATIWGSGLKHGKSDIGKLQKITRKLDVRLVRGPETRKVLLENGFKCPALYGDPAIIMPLLYEPNREIKKTNYQVVLHHDTERKNVKAITPLTNDYRKFIDKLVNTNLVISSSLHGIILAEAYGTPAILLSDKSTEDLFKYNDYYYSTGRYEYPIANSIEEALETEYAPIPNFELIINNIIDSFPYDLWDKSK